MKIEVNKNYLKLDLLNNFKFSKNNNITMVLFLTILKYGLEEKSNIKFDLNKYNLTQSEKRKVFNNFRNNYFNLLNTKNKIKSWDINKDYKNNLISIKVDSNFIDFLKPTYSKREKNMFFSQIYFNNENNDLLQNDKELLISTYTEFSKYSNIFKNKTIKFITDRIPLTKKETSKLDKGELVNIGENILYSIKEANRFNYYINPSENELPVLLNKNKLKLKFNTNRYINNFEQLFTKDSSKNIKILNSIKEKIKNNELKNDSLLNIGLDIMSGSNTAIIGYAGTGKTKTTMMALNVLKNKGKKITKLAFTNKAAIGINGTTFHSFFNIPKDEFNFNIVNEKIKPERKEFLKELIINTDVFVIEEISMVSSLMFQLFISFIVNYSSLENHQFIIIGDMTQLPPVANKVLVEKYGNIANRSCLENSELMDIFNFQWYKLTYNFRATDNKLKNFQEIARKGFNNTSIKFSQFMKKARYENINNLNPLETLCIVGKNKTAIELNKILQNKNNNKTYTFFNQTKKGDKIPFNLKQSDRVIISQSLHHKDYITFNSLNNIKYRKGDKIIPVNSFGQFLGISLEGYPLFKIELGNNKYKYIAFKEPVKYKNYEIVSNKNNKELYNLDLVWPFTLGYAITTHKVQCETFSIEKYKNIYIDYSDMFLENHFYTALTRLTNFKQLVFPVQAKNLNLSNFISLNISQETIDFYQWMKKKNDYTHKRFNQLYNEMIKSIEKTININNYSELINKDEVFIPLKLNNINNYSFNRYKGIKVSTNGQVSLDENITLESFVHFINKNKNHLLTNDDFSELSILFTILYKGKKIISLAKENLIKEINNFNKTILETRFFRMKENNTRLINIKFFNNFDENIFTNFISNGYKDLINFNNYLKGFMNRTIIRNIIESFSNSNKNDELIINYDSDFNSGLNKLFVPVISKLEQFFNKSELSNKFWINQSKKDYQKSKNIIIKEKLFNFKETIESSFIKLFFFGAEEKWPIYNFFKNKLNELFKNFRTSRLMKNEIRGAKLFTGKMNEILNPNSDNIKNLYFSLENISRESIENIENIYVKSFEKYKYFNAPILDMMINVINSFKEQMFYLNNNLFNNNI